MLLSSLNHRALENTQQGGEGQAAEVGDPDGAHPPSHPRIPAGEQTPLRWIISVRMERASSAEELSAV